MKPAGKQGIKKVIHRRASITHPATIKIYDPKIKTQTDESGTVRARARLAVTAQTPDEVD